MSEFSAGYDWSAAISAVTPPGEPYRPEPQPDGTIRVVLTASCRDEPAECRRYDSYRVIPRAYQVFDVPTGIVERWEAAAAAFDAMQEEIEAVISARSEAVARQRGAKTRTVPWRE